MDEIDRIAQQAPKSVVSPEGLQTRHRWELHRAVQLAAAIGRHADQALLLKHAKRVCGWATELAEHVEQYGLIYRRDMAEQAEAEADEEEIERQLQEEGQG